MKLTYWKAESLDDNDCYSIRTKTKNECIEQVASRWNSQNFSTPRKVTVEYTDGFDLLDQCLTGEYRANWEY